MVYHGGEVTGGRRVYVGNINYETKEEDIKTEFSLFGLITAISYKQGFAFIDYEDTNDASDAISKTDGQTMWGRRISVELSKDAKTLAEQGDKRHERPPLRRDDDRSPARGGPPPRQVGDGAGATKNLFVANIPEGVTEADVQDHFAQYGPVTVVKFLPQKGSAKSGFVDFTSADDATRAHEGDNVVGGSKLRTDYNRKLQSSQYGGAGGDRGGGGGGRGGGDRGRDYDRRDRDMDRDRDRDRDREYDRREYDRREVDRREYERRDLDRYDDRRDYGRPDPYAREREHDRRMDDRRPHDDYDRRDYRPPPPRYDDRRYDDYDRRDMGRGPPPPARYEERRYDELPPPRRDYDDYDRRDHGRPPPGPPPPRYDDRAPPRYDDRAPPRHDDDRRYDDDRRREMDRPFEPPRHNAADRREYGNGMREMNGDRGGEM